jgi:hypothetical protein
MHKCITSLSVRPCVCVCVHACMGDSAMIHHAALMQHAWRDSAASPPSLRCPSPPPLSTSGAHAHALENPRMRHAPETLPLTHRLLDLHSDGALGDVPHDAGLSVVPLVGHALRRRSPSPAMSGGRHKACALPPLCAARLRHHAQLRASPNTLMSPPVSEGLAAACPSAAATAIVPHSRHRAPIRAPHSSPRRPQSPQRTLWMAALTLMST